MSDNKPSIEFSFIIPVYNSGTYLIECLDSVFNQLYNHSYLEIIIIDDASTDPNTIELLKKLNQNDHYKGILTKIIFNPKNLWSAETRNIGVKASSGKYLICLDSDDTIEPEFLKYTSKSFAAYPNASWVYPSVRKFGYRNKVDMAPEYSAKKLFLSNYLVITSPMKREIWEKIGGQRSINLYQKIKLFEDWDFWQRALQKKYFGVPMRKVLFNYRQTIKSNISRTEEEGNLTNILSYRHNWKSIFGIKGSQKNYNKSNEKYCESPSLFSRSIIFLLKKSIGRSPNSFQTTDFIKYLFFPSQLVNKRLDKQKTFTKAHKMAGFRRGFTFNDPTNTVITQKSNRTALCTHFWWHIGGAENILLDYMNEIKKLDYRIVDVAMDSFGNAGTIKNRFMEVADFQLELDTIANGPYPRMLALWDVIKEEKPAIILNMSNPLLYILSPLIKEKFPNTVIYDLLHCEDFDDNGWFEAAYQYQDFIDTRIVTSDFWKEVLIQKYNERSNKIKVIFNKINYQAFDNNKLKRNDILTRHQIDHSKKIIGFIGRFQEQKRPDIFLKAVEKMQSHPDYHFVMAGQGEMLEELLPTINRLSNLTYIGPTKNPEKVMPMFDIAVFPSKYEGYPLVGIEAAYIGLPIIASNIVGFSEQILNGNFGKLYDVKSEEEDSDSIKHLLLNHYEDLIELGKNGPSFVEKYHNQDTINQHLKELFSI